MPRFLLPLLAAVLLAAASAAAPPPNVVLVLADDLGFSDLGCYGGEIATPNLDKLAADGLKFTQFYNTCRCWPSRAATMTGYYAQQVRRDKVPGVASGAGGVRPGWAPLLPVFLKEAGYRTYHSGKWHIDSVPLKAGFDKSYSLNDHDRNFYPKAHTLDDKPLPPVDPKAGYYSTNFIAGHAVECLKEHAEKYGKQPFFSFVAFTVPHFPVQASPGDIEPYSKSYLKGWDKLREERWARQGFLKDAGASLSPIERDIGPPYDNPKAMKILGPNEVNRPVPWDTLNADQKAFQAAKMAVHAAMVDRMDREIGRVLTQLDAMKATENTIVIFLSDNGASAEIMVRGDGHDPEECCGTGATFLSIGPGWSSLANTPFRRHKTWVHEGGISTPFLVRWPAGITAKGELRHTPAHVVDLFPTLTATAGVRTPELFEGHPYPAKPGKSLLPAFAADETIERQSLWWLHEKNRALRIGDWKIVASGVDAPWELYDLAKDRCETNDLASSQPDRVKAMAAEWTRERDKYFAQAKEKFPPQPPKP
jgi:arylsulfatase A-like enzyme